MGEGKVLPPKGELEQSLSELRGVKAARVVISKGKIDAVHILAEADRSPKQVVRDVESILEAKHRLTLDHKKISVAQVDGIVRHTSSARPQLISLGLSASGTQARARVELSFIQEHFLGEAEGANTAFNRLRLTAEATLKAVEGFVRQRCTFLLEDVALVPTGRWETALVVVTAVTPKGEELLIGAVIVEGDPAEAMAKAALSAVNRRLSFFTAQEKNI